MWQKISTGVVVVGLLGFGTTSSQAQQVTIPVPTNQSLTAELTTEIVVTAKPTSATLTVDDSSCWASVGLSEGEFPAVHIVAVSPGCHPQPSAISFVCLHTLDIFSDPQLSPGDRLTNLSRIGTCFDGQDISYDVYVADLLSPGTGAPTLIAAPSGVTLDLEGEAIIKGDSDADGSAEAVIVQQGGPAVHTTLWSDLPLQAGDRICDFEELWTDDDTGETYYFAYVEW